MPWIFFFVLNSLSLLLSLLCSLTRPLIQMLSQHTCSKLYTSPSVDLPLSIIINLALALFRSLPTWTKIFLYCPHSQILSFLLLTLKYRPISLLSIVNYLKNMLHKVLLNFCLSNHLISESQFGFLPQRVSIQLQLHFLNSICPSHTFLPPIFPFSLWCLSWFTKGFWLSPSSSSHWTPTHFKLPFYTC